MKPNYAETLEDYRQARRSGRRFVSEKHSQGESGFLPLLEEGGRELAPEMSLGLLEIPLKKIRGTYSAGRQSALAGNFMPLLGEETEFSRKWREVLSAHLDEGLRDPIQVYEYLGYYYVKEGNKRVSILSYMKAYSYTAQVIRQFPPPDSPDEAVRVFYEMLGEDRRRPIRHMWFSRHGTYTKLMKLAAQYEADAETLCQDSFQRFRQAFHVAGYTDLPITTGDAFYEYVQVYGFSMEMPEKELILNVKNCEPQFALAGGEADVPPVMSRPDDMEKRNALLALLPKSHKQLSVAFVYAGNPPRGMSAMHDTGRFQIEREYPHVKIHRYFTAPDASDAYTVLSDAAVEAKPHLLFATDRRMEAAALRVALEERGTLVLQCGTGAGRKALSTYYGKTPDAAFLCGVVAGALSESGRLGFVRGRPSTGGLPQDIQAFAQGVRIVRPKASVLHAPTPARTIQTRQEACAALAEAGCDFTWLPVLDTPLEFKHFAGVFGQVCALGRAGKPWDLRRIAVAAWHWDAFYTSLLQKITQDGSDLSFELPLRFRMGLGTGLVDAHLTYPVDSPWIPRLFAHFRDLLARGEIKSVDEEMAVEIEEI